MSRQRTLDYRVDIDGLRALAIVAVLLFHLDETWLPGGFLGVDVFFVISGFLITAIVRRQVEEQRFSLIGFWRRRIRRLYPALVVMVAGVLVAGCLLLPNPERAALPLQAFGALASFENVLLWRTTGGYWDSASEDIALLHCWSLSLEEQFYLVFPPLVAILHRRWRRGERGVIFLLLCVSALACVVLTPTRRIPAFYLLPTRMWELLCGALASTWSPDEWRRWTGRRARWLQVAGLAVVIGSFVTIENDEAFPGLRPLLPCLGTVLLLVSGDQAGPASALLSLPWVAALGKISYSLYLWHWPVIVLGRFASPSFHPLVAVALSLVVAVVSFCMVEKPMREGIQRQGLAWTGAFSLVAAGFLSLWLVRNPTLARGLADFNDPRAIDKGITWEATQALLAGRFGVPPVAAGEPVELCLVGSSHARVLCPAMFEAAEARGERAVSLATSAVGITTPDAVGNAAAINGARRAALANLAPRVVIVAGRWEWEIDGNPDFERRLSEELRAIAAVAGRVIVVGQAPAAILPTTVGENLRRHVVALTVSGSEPLVAVSAAVPRANERVAGVVASLSDSRVTYVDPRPLFEDGAGYLRLIVDDAFVYVDDDHLNAAGGRIVFDRLVDRLLRE